jgi:hypothetical protein
VDELAAALAAKRPEVEAVVGHWSVPAARSILVCPSCTLEVIPCQQADRGCQRLEGCGGYVHRFNGVHACRYGAPYKAENPRTVVK